jgi:hypothetical protein
VARKPWHLPPSPARPGWIEILVVTALCATFTLLSYAQIVSTSATNDEVAHLSAGYSYLAWNDYRLNPEHPTLLKKFAALPLLWLDAWPHRADLTQPFEPGSALWFLGQYWSFALVDPTTYQWDFAHQMFYGVTDAKMRELRAAGFAQPPASAQLAPADFLNDTSRLFTAARLMLLMLSVGLALLVYAWTRELFGVPGAMLALTLFCFDPNFLGNSGLVTTDTGISFFMFGAMYFLWRTCRRITVLNVFLTVLFFALAFVTKFSAALLVPMLVLLGIVRIFSREDWAIGRAGSLRGLRRKALAFATLFAACALGTYATIWSFYGFRYSAVANVPASLEAAWRYLPSDFKFEFKAGTLPVATVVDRWAAMASLYKDRPKNVPGEDAVRAARDTTSPTLLGRLLIFAEDHRLLPESYLFGFAFVQTTALAHCAYLLGESSDYGFRSYFLWTFLLKTPLPALLALAAAFVVLARRRFPWTSHLAFFAIPVVLYAAAAVATGMNIGHRHLLPIYPFLFVLCGALALPWRAWKPATRKITAAAALGAVALSAFVVFSPPWNPQPVFPHYLAYFNEFAGGPRNGHKSLVDSNLDWGQDLPGLKKWTDAHLAPGELINLCYFGTASPLYHGIPHVNMPSGYDFEQREQFVQTPDGTIGATNATVPGYLAISATKMSGVILSDQERELWREILKHGTLVDTIGNSIFIYKIDGIPTK